MGVWAVTPTVGQASDADKETPKAAANNTKSKFTSPEDGWLDMSGFLDKPYGFVPLLIPITEPAVGYGAAGGLAFIKRTSSEARAGFGRPDITTAGGLATENGTWGIFAGDLRHWHGDRFETLVGVVKASLYLNFYGIGEQEELREHPLAYNLETLGGVVRGKYRIGNSRTWAGLGYMLASMPVQFEAPAATPGLPDFQSDTRVGGLTPSLTYDSRENMFTPTSGTYFDGTAGLFDQALGGDSAFQRFSLMVIHYWPLHPRLTLGIRGRSTFSFGDTPFYMRPFILLRGVEVMRYQGDEAADVETELRWQFWKRFSLVGFAGSGAAWNDFEHLDNTITVLAGGTGFRYEVARKHGLHMGLDVGFGPDGPIVYVVFGSAWMRP